MKPVQPIKYYLFLFLGAFEVILGGLFLVFTHIADSYMTKDGIGDLAMFSHYSRLSGFMFSGFAVVVIAAMFVFLYAQKTIKEAFAPITFPASFPLFWVPAVFCVMFIVLL